jgi:hypothetical protein
VPFRQEIEAACSYCKQSCPRRVLSAAHVFQGAKEFDAAKRARTWKSLAPTAASENVEELGTDGSERERGSAWHRRQRARMWKSFGTDLLHEARAHGDERIRKKRRSEDGRRTENAN